MQDYHLAWLSKYADRDAEWLKAQLAAGFHVHHVDGNHANNDPDNLVLVWGPDHMANLHGMKKPPRAAKKGPRGPQLKGQLKRQIRAFDDYLRAMHASQQGQCAVISAQYRYGFLPPTS